MNAVTGWTKVMVCGAAAVALTAASGWTFVKSTAMAPWVESVEALPTVVIVAKAEVAGVRLARGAGAGLLQ